MAKLRWWLLSAWLACACTGTESGNPSSMHDAAPGDGGSGSGGTGGAVGTAGSSAGSGGTGGLGGTGAAGIGGSGDEDAGIDEDAGLTR